MTFDLAFDRLIGSEGGYTNDPNDPGGETNWGITWPVLREAIVLGILPQWVSISTLERSQARDIYKHFFWNRIHADTLPDGIAYQVFDFAVNSGIDTAVRYFQRALGVADDGYWGPVSQQAANNASETDMIMALNAERLNFMTRLKNWPNASRGWARRIAQNLRYGTIDS